jgi:hypothetical protein
VLPIIEAVKKRKALSGDIPRREKEKVATLRNNSSSKSGNSSNNSKKGTPRSLLFWLSYYCARPLISIHIPEIRFGLPLRLLSELPA